MSLIELIKQRLTAGNNPFPFQRVGAFRLIWSYLPSQLCEFTKFHLDKSTKEWLDQHAFVNGFTTEELLRQLVWHLRAENDENHPITTRMENMNLQACGKLLDKVIDHAKAKKENKCQG